MDEESNPIKDLFYKQIEEIGEKTIQSNISQGNSVKIIEEILNRCIPEIVKMEGNTHENHVVLATSIMHYLLTMALIPSQRKIENSNVEIDIAIPDLRALLDNPQESLLICIPKKTDPVNIQEKLKECNLIQPFKKNIWMIVPEPQDIDLKIYNLREKTFCKILEDINEFLSSTKKTYFKILK